MTHIHCITLLLAEKPFTLPSLPYANHVYRLPSLPSSPDELQNALATIFLALLDLTISTIRHAPDYPAGRPSYNVVLTLEHMYLIPRRFEAPPLPPVEGGEQVKLSVNALGFAGMLLAKNDAELEAIKKIGIGFVLRSVGLESVHDVQVAGTSLEVAMADDDSGETAKFWLERCWCSLLLCYVERTFKGHGGWITYVYMRYGVPLSALFRTYFRNVQGVQEDWIVMSTVHAYKQWIKNYTDTINAEYSGGYCTCLQEHQNSINESKKNITKITPGPNTPSPSTSNRDPPARGKGYERAGECVGGGDGEAASNHTTTE